MRKLIYTLVTLFTLVSLLNSCRKEEKSLFSMSAGERVEHRVQEYRDLLPKAQYGWLMSYFYGDSQITYGGVPLCVSFKNDGTCTFESITKDGKDTVAISQYALRKDYGPTLNFLTYNTIFHYYSDPDIQPDGEDKGVGYKGDYEFVLGEINKDRFQMTGKKFAEIIDMTPLTKPAAEYLKAAREVQKSIENVPFADGLKGTLDGTKVTGEFSKPTVITLNINGDLLNLPFMYTDTGIKLYPDITYASKPIKDLIWDPKSQTFASSDGRLKLEFNFIKGAYALDQYLGDYTLTFDFPIPGKDPQKVTKDVSIVHHVYSSGRVSKAYLDLTGLDFPIRLIYQGKLGNLLLVPQKLNDADPKLALVVSNLPKGTDLSSSRRDMSGFVSKAEEVDGKLNISFVDRGTWMSDEGKSLESNSLVLWDLEGGKDHKGGFYLGGGAPIMMNLKLVRK